MRVLFEPPLVIFLIAGLGCTILAITGLVEAVRKFREARRPVAEGEAEERPTLGLRFVLNLTVTGILAFVGVQLLSTVVAIAPYVVDALGLVGSPAPEVSYSRLDVEGQPQETLSGLRGDVVLLNVWATWCPPCRKEMPELDRLQVDLGGRGLTILHVSSESPGTLLSWLEENPMSTRHGRLADLPFTPPALPTSLVIDREGIVRDVMVGGRGYGDFEEAVTPWL